MHAHDVLGDAAVALLVTGKERKTTGNKIER